MAISLSDNINYNAPKHSDARYGPWSGVTQANANILPLQRTRGLTVGIIQDDTLYEYWYYTGVTDTDLILKSIGGGGSNSENFSNVYYVKPSGNDATAVVNSPASPWKTIKTAALAAYNNYLSTGNWNQVYVYEGVYTEQDIAYPYIEMYFQDWAVVKYSTFSDDSIINDKNAQGPFQIRGRGRFYIDSIEGAADKDALNFRYCSTGITLDLECYEITNGQFWTASGNSNRRVIVRNTRIKYDFHIVRYATAYFDNCTFLTGWWKGGWSNAVDTQSVYNNCRFELPATVELTSFYNVKNKDGSTLLTENRNLTYEKNISYDPTSLQDAADQSDYRIVTSPVQGTPESATAVFEKHTIRFINCVSITRRQNTIGLRWYELRNNDLKTVTSFENITVLKEGFATVVAGHSLAYLSTLTDVRKFYINGINTADCSQETITRTGASTILVNPSKPIGFNPGTSGMVSTNVEDAIKEVNSKILVNKKVDWMWSGGTPGGGNTYVDFVISGAAAGEISSYNATILFIGKVYQTGTYSVETTFVTNDTIRVYTPSTSVINTTDVELIYNVKLTDGPSSPSSSPSFYDKSRNPLQSFGNYNSTGLVISNTPVGYVSVLVNGRQVILKGDRTGECYFSSDGGTTAKALNAITSGDTLYWNQTIAGLQLLATFYIDLNYNT